MFTLWVMALMSAVAMGLITRAELSMDAMARMDVERTGRVYLRALGKTAAGLVASDGDMEVDALTDAWGRPVLVGETELANSFLTLGHEPEAAELRLRIEDDSAKLNLNWLLPAAAQGQGMPLLEYALGLAVTPTEVRPLADALIDWWDPNDAGPFEGDHYRGAGLSYGPPNEDLRSISELRFVSGVTDVIFEGEDANGNGVLDPEEDDGDLHFPYDNADGVLQPGLRDLFTVYGEGGINVNTAGAFVLDTVLSGCMPAQQREIWVKDFLRRRHGADGLPGTADDAPLRTEADIAAALGAVYSGPCGRAGVDLVLQSVAFRAHLKVWFPEARHTLYGELVMVREEERLVSREWRSWS